MTVILAQPESRTPRIVEGAGERRRCQRRPRRATSAPGPRSAGNAPHPAWIQQHVFLLVRVPLPCWSRGPAFRTPGIGLRDLVQDGTRTESLGPKAVPGAGRLLRSYDDRGKRGGGRE